MREAHGGIGRVDALAAGARCAEHVDAHVVGVQVHFDVVGQHGQELNAGERGVAARLRIGRRDAHQAVHADLRAQHAVRVATFELDGSPVDANAFGIGDVEDVNFPTLDFAVV